MESLYVKNKDGWNILVKQQKLRDLLAPGDARVESTSMIVIEREEKELSLFRISLKSIDLLQLKKLTNILGIIILV